MALIFYNKKYIQKYKQLKSFKVYTTTWEISAIW